MCLVFDSYLQNWINLVSSYITFSCHRVNLISCGSILNLFSFSLNSARINIYKSISHFRAWLAILARLTAEISFRLLVRVELRAFCATWNNSSDTIWGKGPLEMKKKVTVIAYDSKNSVKDVKAFNIFLNTRTRTQKCFKSRVYCNGIRA